MRAPLPLARFARRALVALLPLACAGDAGDSSSGATTDTTTATTTAGTSTDADTDVASTSATTDATTGDGDDPAWMTPYCYPVSPKKWLAPWADAEAEVVALINQRRAAGVDCGATGVFPPAGPLTVDARLHCAARVHSQDMSERAFFDHVDPDGQDPFDRLAEAGYDFLQAGENIAGGPLDPKAAVDGWLASPEHCANLMNAGYTQTGVGFYEGAGPYTYYWTQTFGLPT